MAKPKSGGNQSDLIRLAIAGIDAQIKELSEKRVELAAMVAGAPAAAPRKGRPAAKKAAATPAKKRKVSAATRKKLKERAKARWEKYRAEQAAS